ncbi:MAG: tRNA dihydrouridine synthase DusB [Ignavibacteriales bacterium]|nr:tRNA dihydrouridine synthase DusB [Ignavibacteriales bacterium]
MSKSLFKIKQAVALAPMENVTDISFRLLCKKFGADIVYTEFVNSEGLIRNVVKTKNKMEFLPEERPIGIQIYGSLDSSMEQAARMAEELQPDLIDINAGCWVRKVSTRGAGAGLLKDTENLYKIVNTVVKSVNLPVTVKTRLGWDENSIEIIDVSKMIEDAGAQAITIHCRTRSQGHSGNPDYDWISKVKDVIKIPIIVNGGITTPQIAKSVFDSTQCDGVMIARGAINNPFIFREIKHFIKTGNLLPPPSLSDRVNLLIEHLNFSVKFKGERKACLEIRKHYSGYLRDAPNISKLRMRLMTFTEQAPIIETLLHYLNKYSAVSDDSFDLTIPDI